MRILADENCRPAHVSALASAGHDVVRVGEVLDKGASDPSVIALFAFSIWVILFEQSQ